MAKVKYQRIKISKSEYLELRNYYQNQVNKVVDEITYENPDFIAMPTQKMTDYEVLSISGDCMGIVVKKNCKIYRCVRAEYMDSFLKLWEVGILQNFSRRGYIPRFRISDYYLEDFPILLEMETIQITPYHELKDIERNRLMLFVSFLQEVCKKVNCCLLDPHCNNFTIVNHNRFVYFDIGSISLESWNRYKDYSIVVSCCCDELFSKMEKSIFCYYYLCNKCNKPANKLDTTFEYKYQSRRLVRFHAFFSSLLVRKRLVFILRKKICLPEDMSLFFNNKDRIDFTN